MRFLVSRFEPLLRFRAPVSLALRSYGSIDNLAFRDTHVLALRLSMRENFAGPDIDIGSFIVSLNQFRRR